jgi:O-antigen/teichoic acid export membrane protein
MSRKIFHLFAVSTSIQYVSKVIVVIFGILLARHLGPEDYGRYTFIMSMVVIGAIPAISGLPKLLIREIAKYKYEERIGYIKGISNWSSIYIAIVSFVVIILFYILISVNVISEEIARGMVIALWIIPIKSWLTRQAAIINGLDRAALSSLPLQIVMPIFSLVFLIVLVVKYNSTDWVDIIYAQLLAFLLATIFSVVILKKSFPKESINSSPEYEIKLWHNSLFPFTLMFIMSGFSKELATVFLGVFSEEEYIGFFKVASQGVILISIGLQAVNSVTAPKIAKTFKKGDLVETQNILSQSVRYSVMLSLPFFILFFFFGGDILVMLFGAAYKEAYIPLMILCIGQLFNVCIGSVGLVLNMTGNERHTLRSLFISLSTSIFLFYLLIPKFDAVGAALSVSISLVLWNILMAFSVRKLTGLKTWIS